MCLVTRCLTLNRWIKHYYVYNLYDTSIKISLIVLLQINLGEPTFGGFEVIEIKQFIKKTSN